MARSRVSRIGDGTVEWRSCCCFSCSSRRIACSAFNSMIAVRRRTDFLSVEGSAIVPSSSQFAIAGSPLANHAFSYSIEFSRDRRKSWMASSAR